MTGFWVATPCKERKRNCSTERGGPWCFGTGVEEQKINEDKNWMSPSLSQRSAVTVKFSVTAGSNHSEGLINKKETKEGVYLASSVTKVVEGQVLTKILNTTGYNTGTRDWHRGDRARPEKRKFWKN